MLDEETTAFSGASPVGLTSTSSLDAEEDSKSSRTLSSALAPVGGASGTVEGGRDSTWMGEAFYHSSLLLSSAIALYSSVGARLTVIGATAIRAGAVGDGRGSSS